MTTADLPEGPLAPAGALPPELCSLWAALLSSVFAFRLLGSSQASHPSFSPASNFCPADLTRIPVPYRSCQALLVSALFAHIVVLLQILPLFFLPGHVCLSFKLQPISYLLLSLASPPSAWSCSLFLNYPESTVSAGLWPQTDLVLNSDSDA